MIDEAKIEYRFVVEENYAVSVIASHPGTDLVGTDRVNARNPIRQLFDEMKEAAKAELTAKAELL